MDFLVFFTKRIGDREDIVPLARIIVVAAVEGGAGGRDGREEAFLRARSLHRGLQIAEVAADRAMDRHI